MSWCQNCASTEISFKLRAALLGTFCGAALSCENKFPAFTGCYHFLTINEMKLTIEF